MYCSNCGNELKENANFCTNCGSSVSNHANSTKAAESIAREFVSKYRIVIMAYFIWLCSMLCIAISEKNWWGAFVGFAFIYPSAILFLWLVYMKYLRQSKGMSEKYIKRQDVIVLLSLITVFPAIITLIWLVWEKYRGQRREFSFNDSRRSEFVGVGVVEGRTNLVATSQQIQVFSLEYFASLHGKMSRVVEFDKNKHSYNVLFRFTNSNGTVITVTTSDETIAQLTGTQISEQKDTLCINEYSGKTYELSRCFHSGPRCPNEGYLPKA